MRLAFDKDRGIDIGQGRAAFFEFFNPYDQGMGHFLAQNLEGGFADHFGGDEAQMLVGELVFRKVTGAQGEALDNGFEQDIAVMALQG